MKDILAVCPYVVVVDGYKYCSKVKIINCDGSQHAIETCDIIKEVNK